MNEAQITQTAISWVRRARAGDQVAMAALKKARVDVESGRATAQARVAYQAAAKYIKANPTGKLAADARKLGAPAEMSAEATLVNTDPVAMLRKRRTDERPAMPRGYLRGLDNPDKITDTIIGAARYRDGMGACVVALAAGEPITSRTVTEIGASNFTTDARSAAFMHGAQFSGESDWNETAPQLPRDLRPCMLVGQCIGRAAKLQAVREPDSSISDYDPVIGWELGE